MLAGALLGGYEKHLKGHTAGKKTKKTHLLLLFLLLVPFILLPFLLLYSLLHLTLLPIFPLLLLILTLRTSCLSSSYSPSTVYFINQKHLFISFVAFRGTKYPRDVWAFSLSDLTMSSLKMHDVDSSSGCWIVAVLPPPPPPLPPPPRHLTELKMENGKIC